MIPKIIHQVWLGDKERIPDDQREYMHRAKELFEREGYQYRLWDQESYEKEFSPLSGYFRKTCEAGKYGFASDEVRLRVLDRYGGIYLDTDVLVLKSLTPFLEDRCFFGYILDDSIGTAVIGMEPGFPLARTFLRRIEEEYGRTGRFPVNNDVVTALLMEDPSFLLDGREFVTKDGVHLYPRYYFEKNTAWYRGYEGGYTRHYPAGSWYKGHPFRNAVKKTARLLLGEAFVADLYNLVQRRKLPSYPRYRKDRKKR